MRRLLVICALAAAILVVFGVVLRGPSPALAASPGQSSPAKAIVIAKGVAVRALALDPHAGPDLTTTAAPNRVFALGSAVAPSLARPSRGVSEAWRSGQISPGCLPVAGQDRRW